MKIEQYEISGMVGALADILRYTVKNAGGTASISEEIAWLKQYIMLQSAKFGKRLDVKIYMPEDVKECRIHKLLLQPFVENTIKYAFADQEECALNIPHEEKRRTAAYSDPGQWTGNGSGHGSQT